MPTYVYETCSGDSIEAEKPAAAPRRFEVKQRMSDKALSRHPDTGERVRRVVTGGLGFVCGNGEHTAETCAQPGRSHAHG